MKFVKFGLVFFGVIAATAVGAFLYISSQVDNVLNQDLSGQIPTYQINTEDSDVAVGKRIVTIRNGCVDCHGSDLSGAEVINDAGLGVIHGPNITPQALSQWSDSEIVRAIRHGIDRDGQALVLMPSHEYNLLAESDMAAIISYLRSVPPVAKDNGPVKLGPVGKVLFLTGQAPTLIPATTIAHDVPFPVKPEETVSPEFGKYLVSTACSGCHGPRLQGGPIPGGNPAWPPAADLTVYQKGTATKEDFVRAMRNGIGRSGSKLALPMPVELTAKLNDDELESMWSYLERLDLKPAH